jgi:maltooligosyltrehalose trehalohydrolase
VDLFAPYHGYGRPDDFRAFVDRAHGLGLAVILDVVYNHLGPEGAYLSSFAQAYFSDRYPNEWGEALNFDGPDSGPVREFFVSNAAYWIREYHLDGLRLDATQQIFDASSRHILADVGRAVRQAAGSRRSYVVAENEPQHVRLVVPESDGGYGLDGMWNDDFHHAARVAATGRREAYMSDYSGEARELLAAVRHGFLFQGQRYAWQEKGRGTATRGLPPGAFVNYLQNHDQVANTPGARRLCNITSPGRARALAALLLLAPETPLLFMGEEFGASSAFFYFADHESRLARQVRQGRREFLSQFAGNTAPGADLLLPDPAAPATFAASRLDLSERAREPHAAFFALHRDLLHLRRDDVALRGPFDGAVLASEAFVVRWFGPGGDDRLLLVNLGRDLVSESFAEPLIAAPAGTAWRVRWASEHPAYGGQGQPEPLTDEGWRIPGHAAVLLAAIPSESTPADEAAPSA